MAPIDLNRVEIEPCLPSALTRTASMEATSPASAMALVSSASRAFRSVMAVVYRVEAESAPLCRSPRRMPGPRSYGWTAIGDRLQGVGRLHSVIWVPAFAGMGGISMQNALPGGREGGIDISDEPKDQAASAARTFSAMAVKAAGSLPALTARTWPSRSKP